MGEWATKRAIYTERWGETPGTHKGPSLKTRPVAQTKELESVQKAHDNITTVADAAAKTRPLRRERTRQQEIPVR